MAPLYPVLAVAGATASGKSDLALSLAEAFGGEIVNYDSVQVFRQFDIGTAKPSLNDRRRITHHLFDILDPGATIDAGQYQRRAREVLLDIRRRSRIPILAGGTGLYLRTVVEGLFDGPRRSDYWRGRMEATAREKGREHLHRVLKRLDPESAARIAARDLPKVIRALEVKLETGRPISAFFHQTSRQGIEGFDFRIVGLNPPREALYSRIGERVQDMFASGLVAEVRGILESGVSRRAHAFRAIGYRRVLEYIGGAISLDEAIMLTERDTRRYAKRQMTWFRKQHSVTWFDGFGNQEDVKFRIHQYVDHFLTSSRVAVERSGGAAGRAE